MPNPAKTRLLVVAALIGIMAIPGLILGAALRPTPSGSTQGTGLPNHGVKLGGPALSFESNVGQAGEAVRYLAHAPSSELFFSPSEVVLAPGAQSSATVHLRFLGANASPDIERGAAVPGRVNYIRGNNPSDWHTGIPLYGDITYRNLYKGIDLTYSGEAGRLKGTYTLAPGADPTEIVWRYEVPSSEYRVASVTVDNAGDLHVAVDSVLGTRHSALVELAPVAWQEADGRRVDVTVRYDLRANGAVGFSVGEYDVSRPLIIDPTLVYSTYLGGGASDNGYGMAVDADHNIYVIGLSASTDYPLQDPLQPSIAGGPDVVITKLDPSGSTLIFSTFLGGSSIEWVHDIEVDGSGNVVVAGRTSSTNFPLMNPKQPMSAGGDEAFVTKLNAQGSGLIFSTYLGGSGNETAYGVAVDAQSNVYVAGSTSSSTTFPRLNAIQNTYGGGPSDAFVTKYPPDGQSFVYSTFLGGNETFAGDVAYGVAADSVGNAYVTGDTVSDNFPTFNPFQPTYHGGESDAFITKLSPTGSNFIYSTYLGGGQVGGGSGADTGYAIAADSAGNAYITGDTDSNDFPTHNPIHSTLTGFYDVFVTKMNPTGSALVYSTYVGGHGAGNERGQGIAVNAAGEVAVVGIDDTADFPVVNAVQPTYQGALDAFALKLDASGMARFVTYLGGTGSDYGQAAAIDDDGSVYATGLTASFNFPLANPIQDHNATPFDIFISKITDDQAGTPSATPSSVSSPTPSATQTVPTAADTATPFTPGPTNTSGGCFSGGRIPVSCTPTPSSTGTSTSTNTNTSTPNASASGTPTTPASATATSTVTPLATCVSTWHLVNSPNLEGYGSNGLSSVAAVAVDDAWAVGSASNETTTAPIIQHWDGADWNIVNTPVLTGTASLGSVWAGASDDVWAVGSHTVQSQTTALAMHWDGAQWNSVAISGTHSGLGSVDGISSDDVWAVGGDNILHWDGTEWGAMTAPTTGTFVNISALAPNDVWIAGTNLSQTLVLHYDGSTWAVVPSPNVGDEQNELTGIKAIGPNDVWAIGDYVMIGPGFSYYYFTMHWDGTEWTVTFPSMDFWFWNKLTGITAAAPDDVWVVGWSGEWTGIQEYRTPIAMHWDGSGWARANTINPSFSWLSGVTFLPDGELWAVGSGRPSGGPLENLIEKYSSNFIDVPQGSTFYAFIRCLACRGLVSGYSDGTFRPNNQVTRGQLSKIVSNAASFSDQQTDQMFQDVPVGSTFHVYIGRLASRGYIEGYECGGPGEPCVPPDNLPYFRPSNNATRGQISKIVSNAAGFTEPHTEQTFEDVPSGSTFYGFIERLAARSVMNGYPCGGPGEPCVPPINLPYFRPNNNATRGQTSKIVANTFFDGCPSVR